MISLQTAAFGESAFVATHTIVDRHFGWRFFFIFVIKYSISCPKQLWYVRLLLWEGKEIELVKELSDILVLSYISKVIKVHTFTSIKLGHLPLKCIQKTLPGPKPTKFFMLLHIGWVEQFKTDTLKTRLFWKESSPVLAREPVCSLVLFQQSHLNWDWDGYIHLLVIHCLHVSTCMDYFSHNYFALKQRKYNGCLSNN